MKFAFSPDNLFVVDRAESTNLPTITETLKLASSWIQFQQDMYCDVRIIPVIDGLVAAMCQYTDSRGHFRPTEGTVLSCRYRVVDIIRCRGQSATLIRAQVRAAAVKFVLFNVCF